MGGWAIFLDKAKRSVGLSLEQKTPLIHSLLYVDLDEATPLQSKRRRSLCLTRIVSRPQGT